MLHLVHWIESVTLVVDGVSECNKSGAMLRVRVAPHIVHWVKSVMFVANVVIPFGVGDDIDPY